MVRINGLQSPRNTPFISVDEINPLILTIDPNFQRDIQVRGPSQCHVGPEEIAGLRFPSKRIARPWGKRSLSKQQPYSESTCFSCVVCFFCVSFLISWFSRLTTRLYITTTHSTWAHNKWRKTKTGQLLLARRSMIPLTRSVFPPQGQFPFSLWLVSRNSCAQRQFLKPLLKERDIWYLQIVSWLVHQISEASKKLAVETSEDLALKSSNQIMSLLFPYHGFWIIGWHGLDLWPIKTL